MLMLFKRMRVQHQLGGPLQDLHPHFNCSPARAPAHTVAPLPPFFALPVPHHSTPSPTPYLPLQAKLLEVFRETAAARHEQQAAGRERVLAVLRSDYMLHTPTNSLLQVELNTIASSFGCLSTLVGRMHRYLLGRLGASEAELAALPEHNTMDAIADAMGAAAAEYGVPGAVMVMVVQPGERNAYDQQWLQTRLWERHGVRTLRRSLAQVRGWVWAWVLDAGSAGLGGCLQLRLAGWLAVHHCGMQAGMQGRLSRLAAS